MKQLQQELEIPETPDEPAPTPVPETPVTPEETPETPEAPAEAAEVPAADTPAESTRPTSAAAHSHAATLPQTGVNSARVLGLALAGFSFLTAGLGMELSARRGKHCKH